MSTGKVNYENIKWENEDNVENAYSVQRESELKYKRITEVDNPEEFFQEDPQIFLLNNILMSVQFFENYEREIETVRENWHKEIALVGHQKQCFEADSIFQLVSRHVKFKPSHGMNKYQEYLLHPLRIFITCNNVEAVFDAANFKQPKPCLGPYYQVVIKTGNSSRKEKSGYVSFVEHKPINSSKEQKVKNKSATYSSTKKTLNLNIINKPFEKKSGAVYKRNKSTFDVNNSRRLTKTEKIITSHNRKSSYGRKISFRYFSGESEEMIPNNGFYNYREPKEKLKPQSIHDFRMNSSVDSSIKIPRKCFQTIEVKTMPKLRRDSAMRKSISNCFKTENFLNATAFLSYFCDLLIEKLGELLTFQSDSLEESIIRKEFIIVEQENVEHYVVPTITVTDWSKCTELGKQRSKFSELEWPTLDMNQILKVLPCFAVPKGYIGQSKENMDYEKEWMLVFPKAEKFLLLHMMHSHLRCYFIVLVIYKSFIESEINPASFGAKHLMHLLFWEVRKNFTAWPEDRQGETLIRYMKILYKKLQKKKLRDFFITSRNLFADSFAKDLHKAQVILKRILENPLPYILRALRNLCFRSDFYPSLDTLKLNSILTNESQSQANSKNKIIKSQRKKEKKCVRFEDDEEREWKKTVIRQINLEKKIEENDQISRLSVDSIKTENVYAIDSQNFEKCYQITEIFVLHFIEMGLKSVEYKSLDQAFGYLYQAEKLLELTQKKLIKTKVILIQEKVNNLKEKCYKLKNNRLALKTEKNIKQQQINEKAPEHVINKEINKQNDILLKIKNLKEKEIHSNNEDLYEDDEDEYETKL